MRVWLPTLLVGVSGAILFWNALIRGQTFYERDLIGYYRPAKSLIVPLTQSSGGLPLWNPLFSSGQPFAANPEHELFHPMTALFFLLPFEWAFRLQVILPVLVAAGGMYFLLGTLRRSRGAALFGGLVWGFGGYTLSVTNLLPVLFAVAVLPAFLGFAVRVVREEDKRSQAGLAVAFGLVCVAGEPSTILCALVLLIPTLFEAMAARERWSRARPLARVFLGTLLGATLGAATLLPGVHFLRKTVRRDPLPESVANQWSMPAVRLLELAVPPRDPSTGAVDFDDPHRAQSFLFSIYPGMLTTLLATVAWVHRPRRVHVWAAIAIVGVVIAAGSHLPLWGLLRRLPLVSALRYPEKFVLLSLFSLTVAASAGWDEAVTRRRGARVLAGAVLAFLAILVTAVLLHRGGVDAGRWLAPMAALRQGVLLLSIALLVRIAQGGRRQAAALALAVTVALDLVLAGRVLLPTRRIDLLTSAPPVVTDLLRAPPQGPVFHLAAATMSPRLGSPFLATPPFPVFWGIPLTLDVDFDLTELVWSARAKAAFWEAVRRRPDLMPALLSRRGVGAVIRFRPGVRMALGKPDWPPEMDYPLEVVRPRQPPVLAFPAAAVERVDGASGWVEAVIRLGPAAARTVCLEESEATGVPASPSEGSVRVLSRSPVRIVLDVDTRGPEASFVAVNQTWDEGWVARVDGVATRYRRADLALSGLVVPPGRHRVEISYEDPWVRHGVAISLLALAICLGLVFLPRRKRGADGSPV
ncbi:MAG: hypothetical protein ACM3JH_14160 [Acidithiobacillales bacterium]